MIESGFRASDMDSIRSKKGQETQESTVSGTVTSCETLHER